MKTLVTFDNCGSVLIDPETLDVNALDSEREAISRIYLLNEDVIVKTIDGKTIDAKAGDIVIKFYDSDFPHRVIVVHSDEWKENIETYKAKMEERCKESSNPCECCDCEASC